MPMSRQAPVPSPRRISKIEDRRELELVEHQLMASFGGKMRGEEKISDKRIKSLREQRRGAGYEAIQHHRDVKCRSALK